MLIPFHFDKKKYKIAQTGHIHVLLNSVKEGAKQGRATDEVGTEQTKNKIIKKKSSK